MIHGIEALVSLPPVGRTFSQFRKVRLGDVRPDGSLRFDALIRYAQDVSNDDTTDADLVDDLSWVVRRTTVDVVRGASFGETLEFTTFCSGLGSCWAERRLHVVGDRGAHLEVASLWVHLDPESGRPRKLSEQFKGLYGEAARGRVVKARLHHGLPPESARRRAWPVRFVDFDIFEHMNNAAYWAAVEELIAERSFPTGGIRAELEYGHGVDQQSVGQQSVAKQSVGQQSVAKQSVGQQSVAKQSVAKQSVDRRSHGGGLDLAVSDGIGGDVASGFGLWWCPAELGVPAASGVVSLIGPELYAGVGAGVSDGIERKSDSR